MTQSAALPTGRQVCWLPMDHIILRPDHILTESSVSLSELTSSILKYGLQHPITVRQEMYGRYEILSGNRRYLACRMAGYSHIDAIVLPVTAPGGSLFHLMEQLMRQDLHFLEEAQIYDTLLSGYDLTQEALGKQLNRSASYVANKLRLLKLEPALQALILEEGLTERHARALLRLPDPSGRLRIARQAAAQRLTVRDTELLVDSALSRLPVPPPPDRRVIAMVRDHRLYLNALKGIVEQMQEAGLCADMETCSQGDTLQVVIRLPVRRRRSRPPS